jgi:hypothetical protein
MSITYGRLNNVTCVTMAVVKAAIKLLNWWLELEVKFWRFSKIPTKIREINETWTITTDCDFQRYQSISTFMCACVCCDSRQNNWCVLNWNAIKCEKGACSWKWKILFFPTFRAKNGTITTSCKKW